MGDAWRSVRSTLLGDGRRGRPRLPRFLGSSKANGDSALGRMSRSVSEYVVSSSARLRGRSPPPVTCWPSAAAPSSASSSASSSYYSTPSSEDTAMSSASASAASSACFYSGRTREEVPMFGFGHYRSSFADRRVSFSRKRGPSLVIQFPAPKTRILKDPPPPTPEGGFHQSDFSSVPLW